MLDYLTIRIEKVDCMPTTINNDVVYKLLLVGVEVTTSSAKCMIKMDKKFDGHPWCRRKSTSIPMIEGLLYAI